MKHHVIVGKDLKSCRQLPNPLMEAACVSFHFYTLPLDKHIPHADRITACVNHGAPGKHLGEMVVGAGGEVG